MDPLTRAVTLSIVLYLIPFLVPLIPAITIYKLFPENITNVSGWISTIKINASGAVAGYIIFLLVSFPVFTDMRDKVEGMKEIWTIKGSFELVDQNGDEVDDFPLVGTVVLEPRPRVLFTDGNTLHITLPSSGVPDEAEFRIFISKFGERVINLNTLRIWDDETREGDYKVDEENNILTIVTPIQIEGNPSSEREYLESIRNQPAIEEITLDGGYPKSD